MRPKNLRLISLCLTGACLLSSCAWSPQPAREAAAGPVQAESANWKATYAQLAQSAGKVYSLDPKASAIRIYVFRGGRDAKAGHNHVLSAPQFAGFVYVPFSGLADSRFDLEFRLDQLEIDNPEYRRGLGPAFASLISKEAIDDTRKHMLGEDDFQANRFPFVRVHSVQIAGEAPKLAVKVQVSMHGQERDVWVPLTLEGLPDRISVSGSLVLRQSDFGVHPYSVLGGLLAVQDEVIVDFKLAGA